MVFFILLCIFIVFLMEILNTVVENLVDLLVKKEYHIEAKKAKDIAAGGVLLSASFTVVIAIIIILPNGFIFIGDYDKTIQIRICGDWVVLMSANQHL